MPRGGSRNRSGPTADPSSGRSDRRNFSLDALPAEGYTGRAPAYPLERYTFSVIVDGKVVDLEDRSKAFRKRELELWRELWKTPQACAWIRDDNRWRWRVIANYCRLSVRAEAADAPSSLLAQLHRFADQIGMTTAGLAEMGWAIAPPATTGATPAAAPATATTTGAQPSTGGSRSRLKVVNGGG